MTCRRRSHLWRQQAAAAVWIRTCRPRRAARCFGACAQTSLVLGALALVLRSRAAEMGPAALHTDPAQVARLLAGKPPCCSVRRCPLCEGTGCDLVSTMVCMQEWRFQDTAPACWAGLTDFCAALCAVPDHLEASHTAVMLGTVTIVTAARQALLARWPAFAEATDRSNGQVLGNLGALDLLWVAALPGASEELLFRGALIPSLYPDWCAAGHSFVSIDVGLSSAWVLPLWSARHTCRNINGSY